MCVQGFSEEDKIAVGLIKRPSVSELLFGRSFHSAGREDVSLTDAWVQFLMEETKQTGVCPPCPFIPVRP